MTEPRALPRVLAAWRAVASNEPLVLARCQSCGRELGRVYDSTMGALLHYFQPVPGRVMNVDVAPGDREQVHRVVVEEQPERYGINKWDINRDQARLAPLLDEAGWLGIVDHDDYWVPGDWACEKHGTAPVDRAMLMDRFRRAKSTGKTWDERVQLGAGRRR